MQIESFNNTRNAIGLVEVSMCHLAERLISWNIF